MQVTIVGSAGQDHVVVESYELRGDAGLCEGMAPSTTRNMTKRQKPRPTPSLDMV